MRKILFFLILSIAGICMVSAADNTPPVIALEPMLDRIGWYMSHKAFTFQNRLASELFCRYQCNPAARNIGLLLHQERSLASLEKQLSSMPEPRWIVGGSYQKGRMIKKGWTETDIELLLIDGATGALQREVYREKAGHYKEISFITGKIAEKLKLAPREEYSGVAPDRKNEVWAVLPFSRILSIKDFNNARKFSGTDNFIYQLQQSEKLKNIVSRENMQKILAEHNLHALNNIDIGSAATVGRLLSADRIVYGTVTNGPKKNIFRLDILVVACSSGVVVNAWSGTFSDGDQDKVLCSAADKLLNTPDNLPAPADFKKSKEAVDVESKRLFDVISKSRFQYRSTSVLSSQILALAETYYLLNSKDRNRCLYLCHEVALNLFYRMCPEHWYYIYSRKSQRGSFDNLITTEAQCQAAANFLIPVVESIWGSSSYNYPDSTGRLKFRMLVNAGRCDEAEEVYRNRINNALDITDWDMGVLEMRRKNFRKAGDYFLKYKDYGKAVYAYYLAGDHQLAYRTGMSQKPLFTPRYGEVFLIWIELLEKYQSVQGAYNWYCAFEDYGRKHSDYYRKRLFHIKLGKSASEKINYLRKMGGGVEFYPVKNYFSQLKNYPVYLQGLGKFPVRELNVVAELLKKELDVTTVILPDRPLPVKGVYDQGHHAFSADKLSLAVRYACGDKFPSDGALYCIFTNEAINSDLVNVLFSWDSRFGIGMFSRMPIAAQKVDPVRTMALTAARFALYNTMSESRYCGNYPCLFAGIQEFVRVKEIEFKICSECAEYVKKGNVRRSLRRMGNRSYVRHCQDEDKQNFEIYKGEWN